MAANLDLFRMHLNTKLDLRSPIVDRDKFNSNQGVKLKSIPLKRFVVCESSSTPPSI